MESGEERLIKETLELSRENNKILRKIQGSMRWGRFFKFAYWLIIIGSAAGAYYFLQPFIESSRETLQTLNTDIQMVQDIGGKIPDINTLFKGVQ